MLLNTIKPAEGATHYARRVGRGIGSGLGKTCGRGHKGQKSRNGGFHKVGFEGCQMPLQRRLAKRGFKSVTAQFKDEITLTQFNNLPVYEVGLLALKQAQIISQNAKVVKVISTGKIERAVQLGAGIKATASAKAAIEAAGGKLSD